MSKNTYQVQKDVIERLAIDPILRGDNLGFALHKIGEICADILQVKDVSFWQLSKTGEHLICIVAYNNTSGPAKTMTRISISEIKEYISALQESLYLNVSDISRNTTINRLIRKFLQTDDVQACLHVPLYVNGAFNGVVHFNHYESTRDWNLLDRVFACQIADLAADTIRHTVMSVNDRYIPHTLDLLGNTLDNLLEALELSDGMIRLDEIPITRGYKAEIALKFTNLYRSSPIVNDQTLVVQDINKTKDGTRQLVEVFDNEDVRSTIVAPMLLNNGERIGCVLVSSPVVMEWKPEEIEMVTRTAHYAARFVEDIWSYQDARTLSPLIQRFLDSSQKLNHMMMFSEAILEVGQSAAEVLETGMAFIALRNPDNILDSPWVSGLNPKTINQIITVESESIHSILRNNKQPVLFPNVNKSILPDSLQRYLMEKDIRAARIFPLVYEGQTLGAVFGFYKHARLYTRNERSVLGLFANAATLTLQNAWMYNQVEQGYLNLALDLATTVDARETAPSDVRWLLAELAEKTALNLNVPEREVAALHWAALLHDIGKKDVPEEVLQKSGPLNEAEWELVHATPLSAERMLAPVPQLRGVAKVIRNYREHFDGGGYPDNLRGDQIPLSAKVLAVVDAYTSMLVDRPYQKLRRPKEALEEIQRHSGTQFDPAVVSAFSQVIARVQ